MRGREANVNVYVFVLATEGSNCGSERALWFRADLTVSSSWLQVDLSIDPWLRPRALPICSRDRGAHSRADSRPELPILESSALWHWHCNSCTPRERGLLEALEQSVTELILVHLRHCQGLIAHAANGHEQTTYFDRRYIDIYRWLVWADYLNTTQTTINLLRTKQQARAYSSEFLF